MASARHRPGIRPIRSRICARGRCDHDSACRCRRARGALLAAGTPVHAQTATALPQGDGRDLVAVACSQCHTLNVIMAGREGPVGWKKPRLQHGPARRAIDAARGRHRHPAISSPISARARPAGGGNPSRCRAAPARSWSRARCAVCHDLERVTIVKRQKRDWPIIVANMYARGDRRRTRCSDLGLSGRAVRQRLNSLTAAASAATARSPARM